MKAALSLLLASVLLWVGLGDSGPLAGVDPTAHSPEVQAGVQDVRRAVQSAEAAYDRGDLVQALVDWHRASHSVDASADALLKQIDENIAFVERELDLGPSSAPPTTLETVRSALDARGPLFLAWLSAVAILASWAGLRCPRTRSLGLVGLLIGSLLFAHLGERTLTPRTTHGVVTGEAVLLHSQPHPSVRGTRTLRPGTALEVLASSDRWSNVRLGETEAWIATDGLTRVD